MVGMETISNEGLKGRPNGDNLDMTEKDKRAGIRCRNKEKKDKAVEP